MTRQKFVEYCAQFNLDYVTEQTAKDLVKQARKVLELSKEKQKV